MTKLIKLGVQYKRGASIEDVFVNPADISKVSVSPNGTTVVELISSQYGIWCVETPQQVYAKVNET